ncbi:MAG TPA: hypothetical protein VGI96_18440 [Streptosporangiaceae bacterium]
MPSQDVVAAKAVNALIRDAASPLEDAPGIGSSAWWSRKKYGGLWVGGRVTLTRAELRFAPNAVNRLVHFGDPSFTIALSTIRHIEVESGFVTKIIAVTWAGGTTRFRCFGAARFADQIRATGS